MTEKTEPPKKRFRIAFSFAGEKRDFVEEVAGVLGKCFGREMILYDKYHEAELARYDLGLRLPPLYGEQSDLIVPVLCKAYDEKRWTGWEWVHIFGLLTKEDGQRVMLCRFDHANVQGLGPAAGFSELDEKTPHEFATLILERLANNEGKARDHYTKLHAEHLVPPPPPSPALRSLIPNNLPRLLPFFGREKELGVIREALDAEARTWGALIDGPGGMGKTSLAVRAAYECAEGQFRRIIFVSIKDREMEDDGPRHMGNLLVPGFMAMLNEIARELGLQDFAKSAEDQRVRLLLEALRDAGVLLILDNLESLKKTDRDELFNLVKRLPQGCKAILTSRRRIGSSADTLILEKLELEAALDVLEDLAKRNKLLAKTNVAERTALYTQTGGKPLLLRWVAGQIGRGSCRTFADALSFLRSCPADNDPLEFIFGDLANEFTSMETHVLAALSYFTLPVEVGHIAALVTFSNDKGGEKFRTTRGVPTVADAALCAEVEVALAGLANRSLVVPDQEEKLHALVPLVAEFLRKHRAEVMQETGDWLEKRACALIMAYCHQNHERFPVLDAVWPSVAPALPRFLAGENERLQSVCDVLTNFLNYMGRWDEQLVLSHQAEAKAVAVGDHVNAGWRAYVAGAVHSFRDQADAVLDCATRATAHWERAFPSGRGGQKGIREHAFGIQLHGHWYVLKKDYPAAIAAYRKTVDLLQSLSVESADVCIALNDLAGVEQKLGDFIASERNLREALRVAHAVGNVEGVASYTGNLAVLALICKDWPRGEALARETLSLSEKVGRVELIAGSCHRIAAALVRQGRGAEGLAYARRAMAIYTRLGSANLAGAQVTLKECEEAIAPPAETGTGE